MTEEDKQDRDDGEVFGENSTFLNKALLTIPTAFTPFLFYSFGFFDKGFSKILIFFSCIAFSVVVLTMIRSFFEAEKLMRGLIKEKDKTKKEVMRDEIDESLGKINKFAYSLMIFGFICVLIAIYIEYIHGLKLLEGCRYA